MYKKVFVSNSNSFQHYIDYENYYFSLVEIEESTKPNILLASSRHP